MINIDKISNKHKYYNFKIFFSFFVFSIIVLMTTIIIHVEFSKENNIKKLKTESHLQSQEKKIFLNNFLQQNQDSLLAIRDNPYFREFIENSSYEYNTDFLFFTMMQENKDFMQLRFLDIKGKEKLRFDRKFYGESAYKVTYLQDKSDRYYFKKTVTLKNNEIFFSKIDFNVEKGKVQIPYTPVLRVATPVFIQNELKGVLIVNIFIEKFMQLFTSSPIYNISITDIYGNLVKDLKGYYDKTKHLKELYDENTLKTILQTQSTTLLPEHNLFVQKMTLGNQSILILYKSKTLILKQLRESDIKMTMIIFIITIFLSIPFAILLSRPIKDMFELVIVQADKLHDLATTLEKKVQEETQKNAKKERLLQHQAKLAELGDMIGNIAHQWRHPLTRLSLLLQNLKAFKNKDKLTDKIFNDTMQKATGQIEFMSTTIDNFKDFYKMDKELNSFSITECLQDIFQIIGTILEHANIKIKIINEEDIEIYGVKTQFSHVLLNLIINAKDALEEKQVQNPKIIISIKEDENRKKIITIEDNGGGIDEKIIDDIFDPYFTTKEKKGTGIGLYLSKTIIEDDMKGKISVSNTNHGALFKIELTSN